MSISRSFDEEIHQYLLIDLREHGELFEADLEGCGTLVGTEERRLVAEGVERDTSEEPERSLSVLERAGPSSAAATCRRGSTPHPLRCADMPGRRDANSSAKAVPVETGAIG